MKKEEQPQSLLERVGTGVKYGGIIAGIIGIVTSPEIFILGAEIFVAGLVIKRVGRKKNG